MIYFLPLGRILSDQNLSPVGNKKVSDASFQSGGNGSFTFCHKNMNTSITSESSISSTTEGGEMSNVFVSLKN